LGPRRYAAKIPNAGTNPWIRFFVVLVQSWRLLQPSFLNIRHSGCLNWTALIVKTILHRIGSIRANSICTNIRECNKMVDYANTYIYEITTLQYLSSITKLSSATPLHLFRSGGCWWKAYKSSKK
jgi:hypothetical protein